eukprot:g89.t1
MACVVLQASLIRVAYALQAAALVAKLKVDAATNVGVPSIAISATLEVASARRRLLGRFRRLTADGAAQINANIEFNQAAIISAGAGTGPVDALSVSSSISSSGIMATAAMGAVGPKAVCGNGVCEPGERCQNDACAGGCGVDCPYQKRTCPTPAIEGAGECYSSKGAGRCIGASGACECNTFRGYVGRACDECKNGYLFDDASKECVLDIASVCQAPEYVDSNSMACPAGQLCDGHFTWNMTDPAPTFAPTPGPPTPALPPTPSPVTIWAPSGSPADSVTFTTGLGGFNRTTFVGVAQAVYKRALAATIAIVGVGASDITITDVRSAQRRLAVSTRSLNSDTSQNIIFEVEIQVSNSNVAAAVRNMVKTSLQQDATGFKAVFKAKMEESIIPIAYDESAYDSFDIAAVTTRPVLSGEKADQPTDDDTFTRSEDDTAAASSIAIAGALVVLLVAALVWRHRVSIVPASHMMKPSPAVPVKGKIKPVSEVWGTQALAICVRVVSLRNREPGAQAPVVRLQVHTAQGELSSRSSIADVKPAVGGGLVHFGDAFAFKAHDAEHDVLRVVVEDGSCLAGSLNLALADFARSGAVVDRWFKLVGGTGELRLRLRVSAILGEIAKDPEATSADHLHNRINDTALRYGLDLDQAQDTLVLAEQCGVSAAQAVAAYREADGDIANAVVLLVESGELGEDVTESLLAEPKARLPLDKMSVSARFVSAHGIGGKQFNEPAVEFSILQRFTKRTAGQRAQCVAPARVVTGEVAELSLSEASPSNPIMTINLIDGKQRIGTHTLSLMELYKNGLVHDMCITLRGDEGLGNEIGRARLRLRVENKPSVSSEADRTEDHEDETKDGGELASLPQESVSLPPRPPPTLSEEKDVGKHDKTQYGRKAVPLPQQSVPPPLSPQHESAGLDEETLEGVEHIEVADASISMKEVEILC